MEKSEETFVLTEISLELSSSAIHDPQTNWNWLTVTDVEGNYCNSIGWHALRS